MYACVVAMHAAGCTHTPVYDALIAALRAKGALSAASATATAAPPTRSLLSRVTGLLTGHTQEQPTHTTTDSMSQQSSKGPRKQAHARASQAQPGDDALTDHGAEAIVEPKTRAKRSKHVVTTALVPVAKRSGREASVARRGGAQTQHQAGVPSERGRPLSLWQLQSLCGILRSVKHPEAQAVQEVRYCTALACDAQSPTCYRAVCADVRICCHDCLLVRACMPLCQLHHMPCLLPCLSGLCEAERV